MIRALRTGVVGPRYWGSTLGTVFAVLPEPTDADVCLEKAGFTRFADSDAAWDADFERVVAALVAALRRRFGDPEVVAPRRSASSSWKDRLRALFSSGDDLNPRGLSAAEALSSGARDDSDLDFASVVFDVAPGRPARALVFASDGHPVLWVWLPDQDAAAKWSQVVAEVAGPLPSSALELAWEQLLPARPVLSVELPRAGIHLGDTASWTDGQRVLGMCAGLGVDPHEVYLPPEADWAAAVPAWAHAHRPAIERDFAALGVRVVSLAGATVFELPPRH